MLPRLQLDQRPRAWGLTRARLPQWGSAIWTMLPSATPKSRQSASTRRMTLESILALCKAQK
eukprot:12259491-Prorocentrum_lima.AAC.1